MNDWKISFERQPKVFSYKYILDFLRKEDVDVASAYFIHNICHFFKLPEVTMMMGEVLLVREGVHIDAYSYLLETLGMPEATYKEFSSV